MDRNDRRKASIKMSSHFLGATCDSRVDRIATDANGEFFSRIVTAIKKLIDKDLNLFLGGLNEKFFPTFIHKKSLKVHTYTHIGACACIYPLSDHRFTVKSTDYVLLLFRRDSYARCTSPRLFFTFAREL